MRPSVGRKTLAIFAFSESLSDSGAIRELIAALRPDLPVVKPRRKPIMLRRGTSIDRLKKAGEGVADLLRAESIRYEVIAVAVHRDLDGVETTDDVDTASSFEAETLASFHVVSKSGIKVVPVIPAWETEAWWFLWPDQLAKYRPSWRKLPDRSNKWVDRIEHAKERLLSELRPSGRKLVPDFCENDAPYIAALIRKDGVARSPRGRCKAYERFVRSVDEIGLQ